MQEANLQETKKKEREISSANNTGLKEPCVTVVDAQGERFASPVARRIPRTGTSMPLLVQISSCTPATVWDSDAFVGAYFLIPN